MPSPFSVLSLLLELFDSLVVAVLAVLPSRERDVRSLPLCKGEKENLTNFSNWGKSNLGDQLLDSLNYLFCYFIFLENFQSFMRNCS